jgi:hypothetical protein
VHCTVCTRNRQSALARGLVTIRPCVHNLTGLPTFQIPCTPSSLSSTPHNFPTNGHCIFIVYSTTLLNKDHLSMGNSEKLILFGFLSQYLRYFLLFYLGMWQTPIFKLFFTHWEGFLCFALKDDISYWLEIFLCFFLFFVCFVFLQCWRWNPGLPVC